MAKGFSSPIVYGFIKDCLPKRDRDLLDDAISNRAAWNYGTSEFVVSRISKPYRKIAKKILDEIDDYTEENGPVDSKEGSV